MEEPQDVTERLLSKAAQDGELRARLLANPKAAMERELGMPLAEGHEIFVHEETDAATHLVLPPEDQRSEEEREAARTGAASLAFLKKTMHDPCPADSPPGGEPNGSRTERPGDNGDRGGRPAEHPPRPRFPGIHR